MQTLHTYYGELILILLLLILYSSPIHFHLLSVSVPSPPMSPVRVGGDEAAHVRSIVAGVCHTQEIGKDAVGKLCSHVEADPQEEQVYTCTVYIHVHENTCAELIIPVV